MNFLLSGIILHNMKELWGNLVHPAGHDQFATKTEEFSIQKDT